MYREYMLYRFHKDGSVEERHIEEFDEVGLPVVIARLLSRKNLNPDQHYQARMAEAARLDTLDKFYEDVDVHVEHEIILATAA